MDGIILTLTNHLAANWNKIMQYRESIIVSGAHASTIPVVLFCFVICTYCPFVIISIKLYNYRNLVYCYTCIYLLCVLLNICTLKKKISGAHASTIPPEIVVTLDWEINLCKDISTHINFCKDISTHVSLCIGLCIPSNVLLEMMDNMNPVYY